MLSSCQDCKFFFQEASFCAVNPSYRLMQDKLRSKLTEADINACEVGILPCNDWEPSEELQPLTLELTLSRQQWRQMLNINNRLPTELTAQLQSAIAQPGEILMFPVESSNIAAISYSDVDRILQVNFLSGSRYQYLEVPSRIFDDFQSATSKGRYLNSEIKGAFEYVQVH